MALISNTIKQRENLMTPKPPMPRFEEKGEKAVPEGMIETDCIIDMLSFVSNVKIAHWKADSRTNEHKALGDLYDSVADLTDAYAEIVLGKNGNREIKLSDLTLSDYDHKSLLHEGLAVVADAQAELQTGKDDDLLNILADVSTAINKAKYLLQV